MGFRRKFDGLIAQGYANFQRMVWMAIIPICGSCISNQPICQSHSLNTLAQQGMQISSDFLRNPILMITFAEADHMYNLLTIITVITHTRFGYRVDIHL